MPEINDQIIADEPWRLDICPECGYSVEGLSDQGNCPECGKAFDRTRVILLGWSRRNLAGGGWLTWIFLINGIFLIWIQMKTWRGGGLTFSDFYMFLIGIVLIESALLPLLTRMTSNRPALSQVHMNEVGCWQLESMAHADGNFWSRFGERFGTFAFPVGFLAWTLREILRTKHGPFGWAFLSIAIFFLIFAIRRKQWYKRERISREKLFGVAKPHIWKSVIEFKIRPSRAGWHRIRVLVSSSEAIWPINANVRCTSKQAEQLRAMVQGWMALSRVPTMVQIKQRG